MVATWKHPEFGRFEHNDLWWERWMTDSGEDDPDEGVRFAFVTSGKNQVPSKAAVLVSKKV